MLGQVYCIKNTITNQRYIGITKYSFKKRYGNRVDWWNASSINIKVKNSVAIYGHQNFKVTILEECRVEELAEREIFYIKKFNSLHPSGFNLTSGGNHNYFISEESRDKNRQAHLGKPAWNKGKKLCKEHVENYKLSLKRRIESGEYKPWNKGKKTGRPSELAIENSAKAHMKPVSCYKNGVLVKTYSSLKETQTDGFNPAQVCLVCKGKGKSHRGYTFSYVL